jgi:hypothetical protein
VFNLLKKFQKVSRIGLQVTESITFFVPSLVYFFYLRFVEENKESLSVDTIGFIGVGTLATAIITGLCSNKNFTTPIYVSPRGKKNVSKLQSRHPGKMFYLMLFLNKILNL